MKSSINLVVPQICKIIWHLSCIFDLTSITTFDQIGLGDEAIKHNIEIIPYSP
jgi:hypothetical protein